MRTPALAFPLRTHERLIEGPLWTATLVSQLAAVNAWSRPARMGYAPAVENPVDNLWKTGHVLWITVGRAEWPRMEA